MDFFTQTSRQRMGFRHKYRLCPVWPHETRGWCSSSLLYHEAMEIMSPELAVNREALLRLFPILAHHLVFDDLRNTRAP